MSIYSEHYKAVIDALKKASSLHELESQIKKNIKEYEDFIFNTNWGILLV